MLVGIQVIQGMARQLLFHATQYTTVNPRAKPSKKLGSAAKTAGTAAANQPSDEQIAL